MALESMTNVADDEKAGSESGDGRNLGNLENKENSTAGSSSVSDAISAAAATSNSAQTRFSFYDAAEVQLQISGSGSSQQQQQEKGDLKQANRFNFYNAAELEEKQRQLNIEVEKKRQLEQERLRQLQKDRENQQINERPPPIIPESAGLPSSNSGDIDEAAREILRSLQETEEQRISILQVGAHATHTPTTQQAISSTRRNNRRTPSHFDGEEANPYEDAIKEALDLLRRHRSPASSPAVVVTGGPGDFSSPVARVRLPTPKEHDRLLQMREDDTSEFEENGGYQNEEDDAIEHVGQEEDIADLLEIQKLKAKQRQERMAQYASRLQEFKSSLPNNSSEGIFEHSNFETLENNRADTDSMSIMSQSTKQRDEEVQRGVEKVLLAILERAHSRGRSQPEQETMNDALLRAMDELLQGQSTSDLDDFHAHENLSHLNTKSMDSNPSKISERSVVDELLAEEEDQNAVNARALSNSANNSTIASGSQGWSSKLMEEEKKLPDSMERVMGESNPNSDEDIVDKYATEHYDDDESDMEAEDDEDDEHDAPNDSRHLDRVLGPLSKRAGGTTGVVLDIDPTDEEKSYDENATDFHSTMNYVNSNINQQDQPLPLRKYSTDSEKGITQDADLDSDNEAVELMKTLCAHLIPHSIDQSNRLRQAIPRWDEENPNEAGYRIIRLSRSQLRRVEFAFESIIQDFKNTSGFGALENDASTYDNSFFKDLQEAERLLDKEEKKLQMQKSQSNDSPDFDKASAVSVDTNYLQNHPDFPGIKPTGKGEMGDLEFFHLPIVFKSHVTGFEPTKDLILEPGNVVAGQYLVENELGSAAFSTAYRCIDLSSENLSVSERIELEFSEIHFLQSLTPLTRRHMYRGTKKFV